MLPSAFFRSWLVSESVLACFTLLNSFSTSAWPVVNAVPLARKPSSGMTASTTMRVWTRQPRDQAKRGEFHEPDVSRGRRPRRVQPNGNQVLKKGSK